MLFHKLLTGDFQLHIKFKTTVKTKKITIKFKKLITQLKKRAIKVIDKQGSSYVQHTYIDVN